jgi:hypothetical protein
LATFNERLYQPFESISHLTALEGAATLVESAPFEDRPRAHFLEAYGSNSIEPRYLPVVIIAYHGFLALLNLLQDSRSWINLRAPTRMEAKSLRDLRDRALEFRLFHRLATVSVLTMPNEFYHRLSQALGLDRMLASADRDVAELSVVLDDRVREREEIRAHGFHRWTTTWLAVISGATLGKILVEGVTNIPMLQSVLTATNLTLLEHKATGFAVEVVLAFAFGAFAWFKSRRGETDDDTRDEIAAHTGLDWHNP